MNKLLQRQFQKHFGKEDQLPENLARLLNVISESYDHYEKDRRMIERSIELSSKEMIELNSQVKKSGKDELAKAHEQLKTLLEDINEVLYSVDMVSHKLIQISPACEKVYGYTTAEFLTDNGLWQRVIHPEDKAIAEQYIQSLSEGKQVLNQYRIIHKEGNVRWIENKIIPALDETGILARIDGMTSDITARKQSEEESERSFSLLEATLESTADGILVVDFNGKIVRFNKKFVEITGIPQKILDTGDDEKAIGFMLHQLTNPEEFLSKVRELYGQKGGVSFDIINFKDGRILERYSQPQLINENFVGRVWSFRDITDRKKAEDKIRESEFRYRSLIEQANDAICIADSSMKIYEINPSGCRMLGYSKEEFLGLSVTDLFLAEDLEANPLTIVKLKSGETVRNERRFKRRDGTMVDLEVNGKVLEDGRFIVFGRDITEHKQAEKLIKESELRYRSLIEQATDAICIADSSLKFIDVNPYACKLLGYSKEEALQLSVPDIVFAEDLKTNPFKFDYLKSEEIMRNERRFKKKDGTPIVMEVSTQLMEDGRFIMFGHDISERKKAEETTLLLSDMISNTTDAIIIRDPSTDKIIFWNEGAEKLYGYTKEEAIGMSKQELLQPQFLVSPDAINNTFHNDGFWNGELIHVNKNGGRINVETSWTLRRNVSGAPAGILEIDRDITEKKNAEAALIKRDRQLTIATQIAKLGYWEFDILNGLFTFNDQFYTIFKTTAEKMGGYTMAPDRYAGLFVFSDDRAAVGMEMGNAINSPDPHFSRHIEHRIIYATGEIGWMSVHFYIVKDDNGRTIKTFGVNQDITERKKVEETLRISEIDLESKNTQLEQKNIEVEQFAYIASHDLQEPLRTTSSFVKLLLKQYHGKLDQKADKYLTYILEASERMKELIKNLLDYSQIGNKKELELVDCDKMLHNVLADLGIAISEAGADIKSEPLPVIYGYATELKQLFQNLITNAIKFRKKETPPAITISAERNNGYWQFLFKDNGIGIEEEDIEKIFVIFQRLHSRTEYNGSGIGLSYCKKIVELHKGKIWVESTPGEGSNFQFTIQANNLLNKN